MKYLKLLIFVLIGSFSQAQQEKNILHNIIEAVSENRLNEDIKTLANFGTRHTLSDTLSTTRGIGAARRWIKTEFETISKKCNNCLEVFYQKNLVKSGENNRIIF